MRNVGLYVASLVALAGVPNGVGAFVAPTPRGVTAGHLRGADARPRTPRRLAPTSSRRSSTPSMGLPEAVSQRVKQVAMAVPSKYVVPVSFIAGLVAGAVLGPPVLSAFRLYRTVPDIPNSYFSKQVEIKGKVASVSDGDTMRVRHTPSVPLPLPGRNMGKKLSDETLVIRIYGVDTPEIAHFGKPAQPFGDDAKEFAKSQLEGKSVRVKLLAKDQYQRAVCRVTYGSWPFRKDLSVELLKAGLGYMYRQGGAQYDGRKEALEGMETAAKEAKKGLWGAAGLETPAEYKARQKALAAAGGA